MIMHLICFQGTDKENYPQINALMKRGDWSNILIIKNKETEDLPEGNASILEINSSLPINELKSDMIQKLKNTIKEIEVALSIASGTGKEHMALISALLSMPVGIRLVVYTKNGVEFIN